MPSLDKIGFYTLSDKRAKSSTHETPLQRCELILTDRCNFKCHYCRGLENKGDMPFKEAIRVIDIWEKEGLKNIRFSGGEPTLYKNLTKLVRHCYGMEHIAISTNGSASIKKYQELIDAGVNDFSVSLDACCASTVDKMAGIPNTLPKVIKAIKWLSERVYTTVGIVINENNINDCLTTIEFAYSLGVSDVRVIPSAQYDKMLPILKQVKKEILNKYPILAYRTKNIKNGIHIRGIKPNDSKKCGLALDDMVVSGKYHFPCIIYMREGGKPIGEINKTVRQQRLNWFKQHNSHTDHICKKNCLDVCISHNNKHEQYYK